jgi:hypothetical protein
LVLLIACVPLVALSATPAHRFPDDRTAQQHCPSDIVVWLDLPSGIYHCKGQRYYAMEVRRFRLQEGT